MSIKIRFKRVLCAALMLVVLGSSTGCAAFRTFPKFSKALEKEKRMQKAILEIQKRYGKNAIIKGMNLEEGATALERNEQIGGHKA